MIPSHFQPVSPIPRLAKPQAEAVRDAREAVKEELRQRRRAERRNETGSAQKLWDAI